MQQLGLTDEETAALLRELNAIIENDRFPLSSRILIAASNPREVARSTTLAATADTGRARAKTSSAPGTAATPVKREPGPPMTLGNAAAARVRLIVWCKGCGHQVEPHPARTLLWLGIGMLVLLALGLAGQH